MQLADGHRPQSGPGGDSGQKLLAVYASKSTPFRGTQGPHNVSTCIKVFHTEPIHLTPLMPAEKSISIGFRVTPEFKRLLESAAKLEQRSKTNLLEKLLLDHCRARGLLPSDPP